MFSKVPGSTGLVTSCSLRASSLLFGAADMMGLLIEGPSLEFNEDLKGDDVWIGRGDVKSRAEVTENGKVLTARGESSGRTRTRTRFERNGL